MGVRNAATTLERGDLGIWNAASRIDYHTASNDTNYVIRAYRSAVSAKNAPGLVDHRLSVYQAERPLVTLVDAEATSYTRIIYF